MEAESLLEVNPRMLAEFLEQKTKFKAFKVPEDEEVMKK